jgi:hypothetical protein
MATPLAVAQTLDGPRPERVAPTCQVITVSRHSDRSSWLGHDVLRFGRLLHYGGEMRRRSLMVLLGGALVGPAIGAAARLCLSIDPQIGYHALPGASRGVNLGRGSQRWQIIQIGTRNRATILRAHISTPMVGSAQGTSTEPGHTVRATPTAWWSGTV